MLKLCHLCEPCHCSAHGISCRFTSMCRTFLSFFHISLSLLCACCEYIGITYIHIMYIFTVCLYVWLDVTHPWRTLNEAQSVAGATFEELKRMLHAIGNIDKDIPGPPPFPRDFTIWQSDLRRKMAEKIWEKRGRIMAYVSLLLNALKLQPSLDYDILFTYLVTSDSNSLLFFLYRIFSLTWKKSWYLFLYKIKKFLSGTRIVTEDFWKVDINYGISIAELCHRF